MGVRRSEGLRIARELIGYGTPELGVAAFAHTYREAVHSANLLLGIALPAGRESRFTIGAKRL